MEWFCYTKESQRRHPPRSIVHPADELNKDTKYYVYQYVEIFSKRPTAESRLNIGRHLIIECQGRHAHLGEQALEALLVHAAEAGGASVLQAHFHPFGAGKGITGVVLLAESHITVHTWPEHDYAAFDVFMCGGCDPMRAAEVIVSICPDAVTSVQSIDRGLPFNTRNVSANFATASFQPDLGGAVAQIS